MSHVIIVINLAFNFCESIFYGPVVCLFFFFSYLLNVSLAAKLALVVDTLAVVHRHALRIHLQTLKEAFARLNRATLFRRP